jgi:2-haloalkanoic acid dehalogenase type II
MIVPGRNQPEPVEIRPMRTLRAALDDADTLTFDCYGTLIDWRTGLNESLRELFGDIDAREANELYRNYVPEEARVEAEGYRSYREVLSLAAQRVARQIGLDLPDERANRLAELVPGWPPFPDTMEALARLKQRFRLGVLSNVDRAIFDKTAERLGTSFDFVVTAEDVRSYKPATGHFDRLLRDLGRRERVVHIAQSVYHDGQPTEQLGLAFVWINRYNDKNLTNIRPLGEFPDLLSFARELG